VIHCALEEAVGFSVAQKGPAGLSPVKQACPSSALSRTP
jgi:hypothetical protein